MIGLLALPVIFALQQPGALTTPTPANPRPYWQQRADYTISATLDEAAMRLRARALLRYVNNSPDTLREMYFHQYLNAFRPASAWSAADTREGVQRFQKLGDPNYGYERFTAPVRVDGVPVEVTYPGAPDSTVARIALPRPLAPGDSVSVVLEWEARPSTVLRRQGRRGRSWDFAQWYPKVAVYDRGGWEYNTFRPAGELYGEFGTFDVSLTVRDDQIIGATGVPVAGDPGWARVLRWGTVQQTGNAYGEVPPAIDTTAVPAGFKRVRFLARNVHHFAWSVSPDYLYEGARYDGRVAVNVLYRPGDEREWGNGVAVRRTESALRWLEQVYGPYGWPQLTNLHRLEGGGTEFPMVIMDGSASPGLIQHEGGHQYSYGMLASNEWRSGWMDEGLTTYQTSWEQGATRPERARADGGVLQPDTTEYGGLGVVPEPRARGEMTQYRLDLTGRAQPIGTPGQNFAEFGIYNQMIYSRGSMMYGALRDAIGDSAFSSFLRRYYSTWQFRHVDEAAMRGSAEEAAGQPLGWFFEQWVHRTGLIDYSLRNVRVRRAASGWETTARVVREGEYLHPMPVGVRTASGWTVVRADAAPRSQTVVIRTAEQPLETRLDPRRLTEDWDRRDDVASAAPLLDSRATRVVPDWPFVNQYARDRTVLALAPLAWYGDPGGLTLALRARTNYQGWMDQRELGLAMSVRDPERTCGPVVAGPLVVPGNCARAPNPLSRLQGWAELESPTWGAGDRPIVGLGMGAWLLDGVARLRVAREQDVSRFVYANTPRTTRTLSLSATLPYEPDWLDLRRWEDAGTVEAGLGFERRSPGPHGLTASVALAAGAVVHRGGSGGEGGDGGGGGTAASGLETEGRGYARLEASAGAAVLGSRSGRAALLVRGFLGASVNAPRQRSLGLSARDAVETFENHLLRPAGAPLAREAVGYVALGDAGLRGYSPLLRVRQAAVVNAEARLKLLQLPRLPALWAAAFADGGVAAARNDASDAFGVGDAGVGLALRGRLLDRDITVRLDAPLYVADARVQGLLPAGERHTQLDLMFSFEDLW